MDRAISAVLIGDADHAGDAGDAGDVPARHDPPRAVGAVQTG